VSKVVDIFDVRYGLNLELNALEKDKEGVNFVSRTEKNNGVSAKVRLYPDITPIPAGTISVAAGGSVMESFLQMSPYYSGRDLYYLTPKLSLSNEVKLYYCICLKRNRFRFSFGRQANATLENLLIPSLEEVPQWVKGFSIENYAKQMLTNIDIITSASKMHGEQANVRLDTLFVPINGIASSEVDRRPIKIDKTYVPYIRPSYRQETSLDGFVSKDKVDKEFIFPRGTLYVSTDGQGSHTYAYVSVSEFIPNSNVSVLIPKREMSLKERLYYAYCITSNRYKFAYARKPKGDRLKSIILPKYPPDFVANYTFKSVLNKFHIIIEKLWGQSSVPDF
jgi:hypothetical protein